VQCTMGNAAGHGLESGSHSVFFTFDSISMSRSRTLGIKTIVIDMNKLDEEALSSLGLHSRDRARRSKKLFSPLTAE
jgi:hypothetical protein